MKETPHSKRIKNEAEVIEAERSLKVRNKADVLVCGGGPAGVGAALASAREGARTMLVERWGMPGGMWTAGLMNPFFECVGRGFVVQELVDRLKNQGAWRQWKWTYTFDSEAMRRVLEEMLAEAGVRVLYYTLVTDAIVVENTVRGVVVESKAGREALLSEVVIDSTGDGDVAARSGCAYEMGRPADGLVQPMTLMFEIRGVGNFEQQSAPQLYDRMMEAISTSKLEYKLPIERCKYAPWIINLPARDRAVVQAAHVYQLNPLNPEDLTAATMEMRKQAQQLTGILRQVPELKNVELVATAPVVGVRETRRILGEYYLSYEDLKEGRRFDDAIASCGFGIDIHQPAPGDKKDSGFGAPMQPYEIPYRCLVPKDINGLLVSGRCISGSHEAHASYRVTGTAMATGQAAGVAAAWSVREKRQPRDLPGTGMRQRLAQLGAQFLKT